MTREMELLALAEQQHAALGRDQVRSTGGDWEWEQLRCGRGLWVAVTKRVVRVAGAPETAHQRVWVALLDAGGGSVASHDTALWLWKIPGFDLDVVHATLLRDVRRPVHPFAIIHEPRLLHAKHLGYTDGIVCTSLVRSAFDVFPTISPFRAKWLVHHVVKRSPATLAGFHELLRDIGGKGQTGTVLLRDILRGLPLGSVPADSGNELRFEEILEEGGEPGLRRQVDYGGQDRLGRVDFIDDELRMIFEIDSRTHHELMPGDRAEDARRDAAAAALGVKTVRIKERLIWRDRREVLRVVRDERRKRRAELLVDVSPLPNR